MEMGAKWRTHWGLKLKIKKKIKGVRGLAQEAQPSDLYPYARKSDTWVQKKIIKNNKKQFFYLKNSIRKQKRAGLINKQCLGGYFDLSFKTKREMFFSKFQKILSVNFVGPKPRLLELGAKWRTHWALKLKIKKKIKCDIGLAQEAQPSDLYPYARKSDTWLQKKIIKKQQKTVLLFKKLNQEVEKSWSH